MKKLPILFLLGTMSVLSIDAMERVQERDFAPGLVELGAQPENVQMAVAKVFDAIKHFKHNAWSFDGTMDSGYLLLGLDDEKILKSLVSREKTDIYIIDVGGAMGGWGIFARRVLLGDEACRTSGKNFHIFSVTGGLECDVADEQMGNVTLHQWNQFKIENIEEEFYRRGFDLRNKVDLIVSAWTLKHLVDPFGTLKRMYSLLTPSRGMLLANGFVFLCDGSDVVQSFPTPNWNILAASNAVQLFYSEGELSSYRKASDSGQFLLMRNDDRELAIPLEYTGEVRTLTGDVLYSGQVATVYRKGFIGGAELFPFSTQFPSCYCDAHHQLSKDLHEDLVRSRLFN